MWVANSVDPDQMLPAAASDLGLHYLLRPVCPNTKGDYVISGSKGMKMKRIHMYSTSMVVNLRLSTLCLILTWLTVPLTAQIFKHSRFLIT